jgi:glycine cleavage system H protein
MKVYRGCVFPDDLLYHVERDVWVRYVDGVATMGMTDPAQTRCGKLVSISFKPIGRVVAKGRSFATIESAKWVGPFPAVLTGELLETNEETFRRDILTANREPYGVGWLVKVRPTKWNEEKDELLDATQAFKLYQQKIEEWKINCMRCVD